MGGHSGIAGRGFALASVERSWFRIVSRLFWRGHFVGIAEQETVPSLAFFHQKDGQRLEIHDYFAWPAKRISIFIHCHTYYTLSTRNLRGVITVQKKAIP